MKPNNFKLWNTRHGLTMSAVLILTAGLMTGVAGSQTKTAKPKRAQVNSSPGRSATLFTPQPAMPGFGAMGYALDQAPMSTGQAAMALDEMRAELAGTAIGMSGGLFDGQATPLAETLAMQADMASVRMSDAPMAFSQVQAKMAYGQASTGLAFAPFLADGGFFGSQDTPAPQQSAGQQAYQKAYNLILDKKWADAQKEFDAYISKYSRTSYAVAARYWKCYTREKLGDPLEDVFKSYQQFVEHYGQSNWADDARTSMIRIGSTLAKQGKPEYATIVSSMQQGDDEDIKLTALYALRNTSDEKALPVIVNLYDKSKNEKMREKIVYVLGSFDSPIVVPKLADIATKDPSMSVRKNAVYALGNTKKSEAVEALKKIVNSQMDADVRTTALYSLANQGSDDMIPYLTEIAKNDPNERLAKTATYSIANINSDQSATALGTILKGAKSREVRKAALHSLANHADAGTVALLKQIALSKGDSDDDADMERTAVYALGNIHNDASTAALKEVLNSGSDIQVKTAALQAIGNSGGSEARDILKKFALTSDDDRLSRTAIYALGNTHEAKDTSFYFEVLHNAKSLETRKAALYQIANLNSSSAVSTLGKLIKEEKEEELKVSAIYVLGNLKDDGAVPVLLGVAQKDNNKRARQAAVSALSNIGSKKSQDALVQILEGQTKDQ